MRRSPVRTSSVAAARLVPATLLTVGLAALTTPALADSAPAATLPAVPVTLAEDAPCTGPSSRSATAEPWTTAALGLSLAQRVTLGKGVTVGVVDTGVDADVAALAGRVTTVGPAAEDCVGHGTFAAGLIAAARRANSATTGVAPEASILALRGTDQRGIPSADLTARSIRSAVDQGADVIYVGVALTSGADRLSAAVAYATQHDVLVIAPATPDVDPSEGDRSSKYWPAAAPGALAVIGHGPNGPAASGASPVFGAQLSAPGEAVVGLGPRGAGDYAGTGSSFAAAFAAGTAALVRAHDPGLTAAEVRRRLTDLAYPADVPRLDPYAALTAALPVAAQHITATRSEPVALPADTASGSRLRAVAVAAAGGALVLLVSAAVLVVPRGRARRWRAADGV